MNPIRRIRRLAAVVTGLAVTWLGLATAAPSAFAEQVSPGGGGAGPAAPTAVSSVARTLLVGGMPGWQIVLIAAGAAVLAAAAAVLAYRAWTTRRKPAPVAA
jgi:hypothetical protein